MKKFLIILLASAVIFSAFTSCSKKNKSVNKELTSQEILEKAYNDSLEAFKKNTDPSVPFLAAAENEKLNENEKFEAYYLAAYVLATYEEPDYDKIEELLTKAYQLNPDGNFSENVLKLSSQIKKIAEIDQQEKQQSK